MSKFIELTERNNCKKIIINCSYIEAVTYDETGAVICFSESQHTPLSLLRVKEFYEEVKAMLMDEGK